MTITQQVFNTDDVYVSIYDRPKRGKGRPKSSLTDEEKAQKKGTTIKDGTPRTANMYYLKRSSSEKHRETLIKKKIFFLTDQ